MQPYWPSGHARYNGQAWFFWCACKQKTFCSTIGRGGTAGRQKKLAHPASCRSSLGELTSVPGSQTCGSSGGQHEPQYSSQPHKHAQQYQRCHTWPLLQTAMWIMFPSSVSIQPLHGASPHVPDVPGKMCQPLESECETSSIHSLGSGGKLPQALLSPLGQHGETVPSL